MYISIPKDVLKEIMKECYADGFDDGAWVGTQITKDDVDREVEARWPDSVSADKFDAIVEKVRNGGRL